MNLTALRALGLAACLSGAVLLTAGCQSRQHRYGAEGDDRPRAMMCDRCGATWVSKPYRTAGGKVTVFHPKGRTVCPDCEKAAENYFKTGELPQRCPACGGMPQACEMR